MQRIDENTYIDDTLVTCAEYQLFIDEMREQGKYYQPDHWISCQFPKGQAREPILGVRHMDAVAFCEWLTKRDADEWHYRLPTQAEATEYQLKPKQALLALGYWIISDHEKSRFIWIGSVPKDPRNVIGNRNFVLAFAYARITDQGFDQPIDFDLDQDLVVAHFRDGEHRVRDAHLRFPNTHIDLSRNLDHANETNLDLARELDINLFIDLFTLQERIAGRSPAFEGIRLVKYREQS